MKCKKPMIIQYIYSWQYELQQLDISRFASSVLCHLQARLTGGTWWWWLCQMCFVLLVN